MFRPRPDAPAATIAVEVEGWIVTVPQGASAAAAMLLAGLAGARETAISGSGRAPYCMMGVCFDCLVTIDGVGNRQGCLVPVTEGMQIEIQKGKREIGK
jgi:D-hydroxyproline dehydrogenase subunit gamma